MNYNEIKKFEIEQIIISIKRMLSMGFSIEEITRDIEEDTKKMLANLTAEQLQTNESMKKHRNIKKEENEKGGNVRFRYWNSALLEFIMFDDGVYSYTKSSGFNMAEPEAEFDWQNAEQSTRIAGKECFCGDCLLISFSYLEYGLPDNQIEKSIRGILRLDNMGFYLENKSGKNYLSNLCTIFDCGITGNIHENKELLDERK